MSVNLSNWYTLDSEIVSINYLLGQRIFGLPLSGSNGKESACNVGDWGLIPGLERFSWRREWLPTPIFLSGKFHGQGSLAGYSPWDLKDLDMTERLTSPHSRLIML